MKPLESQAGSKSDIFVSTFHQAKAYTDSWANLNFIVRMKKIGGGEVAAAAPAAEPQPSTSRQAAAADPVPSTSAAADAAEAAAAAPAAAAVEPHPVEEAMA